jgi:hypothetical protein
MAKKTDDAVREIAEAGGRKPMSNLIGGENVKFLDVLSETIAREWRLMGDDCGGLEHIRTASGPEAAYMTMKVIDILASTTSSWKVVKFCDAIKEMVSR